METKTIQPEFKPTFREGTWDEGIWNEASQYAGYRVSDLIGKTVVDVGAHIGAFTRYAYNLGAKEIHSYEAWVENFEVLQKNTEGCENVHVYNKAVWKSRSRIRNVYYHDDFDHTNTGGGGVFEGTGIGKEVGTIGLDDIIDRVGVIDLLKLDAEASEFPILYTSAKLSEVRAMVGEYHHGMSHATLPVNGQDLRFVIEDLCVFLRDEGYWVAVEPCNDDIGKFAAFRL